jgi:hypothetical protein
MRALVVVYARIWRLRGAAGRLMSARQHYDGIVPASWPLGDTINWPSRAATDRIDDS